MSTRWEIWLNQNSWNTWWRAAKSLDRRYRTQTETLSFFHMANWCPVRLAERDFFSACFGRARDTLFHLHFLTADEATLFFGFQSGGALVFFFHLCVNNRIPFTSITFVIALNPMNPDSDEKKNTSSVSPCIQTVTEVNYTWRQSLQRCSFTADGCNTSLEQPKLKIYFFELENPCHRSR